VTVPVPDVITTDATELEPMLAPVVQRICHHPPQSAHDPLPPQRRRACVSESTTSDEHVTPPIVTPVTYVKPVPARERESRTPAVENTRSYQQWSPPGRRGPCPTAG
jgi:hypothetical protein